MGFIGVIANLLALDPKFQQHIQVEVQPPFFIRPFLVLQSYPVRVGVHGTQKALQKGVVSLRE